jgi:hypothetical protein
VGISILHNKENLLMNRHNYWMAFVVAFYSLSSAPSRAVTITADYSALGSVFQDAAGSLFTSGGPGLTDVTETIKLNISTATNYWQNSILMPYNLTISYQLFDNGDDSVVGDSAVDTIDGDGLPATSTIRFNNFTDVSYFIDPTPTDNSEFDMSFGNAALGGGSVNNKRFGEATMGGGALDRWDFLTLVIHEMEHSLGISNGQSSGYTKFFDEVGLPSPGTDRTLTITSALSGLPSDFDIPVVSDSSHYIGDPLNNDIFGFTVVADPGWQTSQRALPTCVDVLGLGQVIGATANQINCHAIPEPTGAILLAAFAGTALSIVRVRRSLN